MDRPGSGPDRDASVDEVMAHFGVKGMHWGVTRMGKPSGPVSTDAKKTTVIRTTARKSGIKALSNKQLQLAITRMNLERQYKALSPTASQRAAKFLSETLLGVGKQQAAKLASDFATKKVGDILKK